MTIESTNFFLETINGGLSILIFSAFVFVVYYILDHCEKSNNTFWHEVTNPSAGMMLARPMAIIKMGLLLNFSPKWYWRFWLDGGVIPEYIELIIITGLLISSTGFCWLVFVLTRPQFGHWPWMISCMAFVSYITYQLLM